MPAGWRKTGRYTDAEGERRKKQGGPRECLRCSKKFQSPDRVRIRICSSCKGSETWRTGDMLNLADYDADPFGV